MCFLELSLLSSPMPYKETKRPHERFLGKWTNGQYARGMGMRIYIWKDKSNYWIQIWAQTRASEIDWGKNRLYLITNSDEDTKDFSYGFVKCKPDFAETFLTLRIKNKDLIVEEIVLYTDGSNRQNARHVERYHRGSPSHIPQR
jgi:hypothetical protein